MQKMSIFDEIHKLGSVDRWIRQVQASIDPDRLPPPRLKALSSDKVVGKATNHIKTLIGAFRIVRDEHLLVNREMQKLHERFSEHLVPYQNMESAEALISCSQDEGLLSAAAAFERRRPVAIKFQMLTAHVRNIITVELELVYELPLKTRGAINSKWEIIHGKRDAPQQQDGGLGQILSAVIGARRRQG